MLRLVDKEVTETRQVPDAYVCDYCGKENTEYAIHWRFHPPGWVYMKWGSDPFYSLEKLACDECAALAVEAMER